MIKGERKEVTMKTVYFARSHGVDPRVVRTNGGVEKLSKLSPEVQRLLLGKSK